MIKVYRYGLLPPSENAALVHEQMRLAHVYRNKLVEIERRRRAAQREALSALPSIAELEAAAKAADTELDAALAVVRKERTSTHKRSETPEMKARVKVARAKRSDAKREFRELRFRIHNDASIKQQREAIDERFAEERRQARAANGLYWGNYLIVEAADDASRKLPLYDGAIPNDPRFVSYRDASEQVGVQLQGGLTNVFGCDTQLRIGAVDERAWDRQLETHRGVRDRLQRTTLKLRVGSNKDRTPIFAEWPMRMHRALPPNSVIKTAVVKRERIGPRDRWSLQLTVDMTATRIVAPAASIGGTVAIDIGWRLFSNRNEVETRSAPPQAADEEIGSAKALEELRVAAYGDESGNAGELRLDARLMSCLKYADHLRGIRDSAFITALRHFAEFLKFARDKPTWLAEATANIAQWRSPARLASVARLWKTKAAEAADDEKHILKSAAYAAAYDDLEKWRYHDFHMWQWETSQRRKSILRRRDLFRCFAKNLALQYDTLVVEEFDLRVFAVRPPIDSSEATNETARHHRQIAALSELRQTLVNAFESRGRHVVKVPAHNTTRRCPTCGEIEVFDAARILAPTCKNGHTMDQDERAWINLLERWRDDDARDGDSVAPRESKWSRLKREKSEKAAEKETGSAIDIV
jgi:hypothetical protein